MKTNYQNKVVGLCLIGLLIFGTGCTKSTSTATDTSTTGTLYEYTHATVGSKISIRATGFTVGTVDSETTDLGVIEKSILKLSIGSPNPVAPSVFIDLIKGMFPNAVESTTTLGGKSFTLLTYNVASGVATMYVKLYFYVENDITYPFSATNTSDSFEDTDTILGTLSLSP